MPSDAMLKHSTCHDMTKYHEIPSGTSCDAMPCHAIPLNRVLWHDIRYGGLIKFFLVFFFRFFWRRRGQFHHWCFQVKIKAAANVNYVTDEMMHACGGVGYKKELGR